MNTKPIQREAWFVLDVLQAVAQSRKQKPGNTTNVAAHLAAAGQVQTAFTAANDEWHACVTAATTAMRCATEGDPAYTYDPTKGPN